jgi:hypothetical protein
VPKGMETPLDPLFYSDGEDAAESVWERVRASSAEKPRRLGRANARGAQPPPGAGRLARGRVGGGGRAPCHWLGRVGRPLPAGRRQPAEPAAPALGGRRAPGAAHVDRGAQGRARRARGERGAAPARAVAVAVTAVEAMCAQYVRLLRLGAPHDERTWRK